MVQPVVSIVIAAHAPNQRWLAEAIESALQEDGIALELVVVDDGSPVPIDPQLLADDPRARLVRVVHAGVSRARNVGAAESSGRYVRFLDADDVFAAGSTSKLVELAGASGHTLAVGATRWCDQQLRTLFDWPASCPPQAARSVLLLRSTPMLPSVLFPRRVIESIGAWDERLRIGEDWDYLIRALENAEAVETHEPMSWYRQHPGSASRDPLIAWEDTLAVVQRYFDRHPDERPALQRRVDAMLDLLAAELAVPRHVWRDRRFWRALARDPTAARAAYVRFIQPRVSALRMRLTGERGIAPSGVLP